MLQCGEPCNPAMDAIGSIQRWESIRQKALLWRGLDRFGSVRECVDWGKGPVGHFIHDSCRLMLSSSSKKLEQAQKRQKKHEVDEFQPQSSSTAEIAPQDEALAAIKFRADS